MSGIMPFGELSAAAQVNRLRRCAHVALAAYPVDVARLSLLNHGFNTTFRVDAHDGRRFALRLNVSSHRTPENLAGEMAWLAALAAETDLRVPVPQPNRQGALTGSVFSTDLRRRLPCALFGWLPGRDVGEGTDPTIWRAVGAATAHLHAHGEQFTLPEHAALPSIDTVLMDTPYRFDQEHRLLDAHRRAVIAEAFAKVSSEIHGLFDGAHRQVLHADLHGSNVKWLRGRLAVFDFDDSGVGVAAQDLAISAYYLRDAHAAEAAVLEGYQTVRPLPAFTEAQYEAVVASRALVLLNDIIVTQNAHILSIADRYVPNAVTKLAFYLEHGQFRHEVPGLREV